MQINFVKTGSLLLPVIILAGLFAFKISLGNKATSSDIDSFSGFSKTTQINIDYYDGTKLISQNLGGNDQLELPATIGRNTNKYQLNYSIKQKDQSYLDFSIEVNKENNTVNILASTDKPKTPVSLTVNNVRYFQDVPTDWSGHIELSATVRAPLQDAEICFALNQTSQTICHTAPTIIEGA